MTKSENRIFDPVNVICRTCGREETVNPDFTISAETLTGTKVTVISFDVIIENGTPLIRFLVKTENGSYTIFYQHELTNYIES